MFKVGQWVWIKGSGMKAEILKIYPYGNEDRYKLKGFQGTIKESRLEEVKDEQ